MSECPKCGIKKTGRGLCADCKKWQPLGRTKKQKTVLPKVSDQQRRADLEKCTACGSPSDLHCSDSRCQVFLRMNGKWLD